MSGIIIFGGLLQGLSFLFLLCLFLPFSFGYPQQFISCTDSSRAAILEMRCLSLWTATLLPGKAHNMKVPRKIARVGKLKVSPDFQDPLSWAKLPVSWTRDFRDAASVHPHQEEVIFSVRRPPLSNLWPCCSHINSLATSLDRTGMAPLLLMPQEKSQCSLQFDVDFKCFLFY